MKQTMQDHWDQVYKTKNADQVSWTQYVPRTSLNFIHSFGLKKSDKIIDIGGGDSKLVDFLLQEGYEHYPFLIFQRRLLKKAKKKISSQASKIKWIVSDVTEFEPDDKYVLWHDRATFHF